MTEPSIADLDEIRERCRRLVKRRAAMSGMVAATPIPFVDAAADVGILLRLLPAISEEFGLSPEEIAALDPETRLLVYTSIKRLGTTFVGRVITRDAILFVLRKLGMRVAGKSVARFAPLIGQATAATLSFWLMRHVGMQHVEDCYAIARTRAEGRLFGERAVVIDLERDAIGAAAEDRQRPGNAS